MEKQYEELCVAFQQIILHFGRMAFQQPGYVTAVLHETAPQTDVLAEALQQLDRADAYRCFIDAAPDDAAQQQDVIRTVQQALAAQRTISPDVNGCLLALGEALQWQGEDWKELLAKPLVQQKEQAKNDVSAAPERGEAAEVDYKLGDQIVFGRYPMSEDGEVEPIVWQVFCPYYDEGQIQLISRDILDAHAFWEDKQTPPENIWWADSALATWLNREFLRVAFTEEEQNEIIECKSCLYQNAPSLVGGEEKLLKVNIGHQYDIEELHEQYPEIADEILQAKVTPYAYAQGAYRNPKTGNGIWRLVGFGGIRAERDDDDVWCEEHPAFVHKLTQTVNPDGTLDLYGDSTYADYVGVRPVIVVPETLFEAKRDENA